MEPICNVFSSRSLTLDDFSTFNGNLYVNGDLDLTLCSNTIEIFGDVILDGNLFADKLIIHGNLKCQELCCGNLEVDDNISASAITDSCAITSNNGSIYVSDTVSAINLSALEGSITICGNSQIISEILLIKAFDEIDITGDLRCCHEIVAGNGVRVTGIINFEETDYFSEEYVLLSVYSGGIHSKNILIN